MSEICPRGWSVGLIGRRNDCSSFLVSAYVPKVYYAEAECKNGGQKIFLMDNKNESFTSAVF